jgi:murein L,D-transpeptidase YcbB/YkuD
MYWAAKRRVKSDNNDELNAALFAYRDVLLIWNDNLNRCLALIESYFGGGIRQELETIYEEYASVGRALDQFVRDVSNHQDAAVPTIGRRLSAMSDRVYRLNLRMLQGLQDRRLGRSAPPALGEAEQSPLLQFGDQGSAVRRLQGALLTSGHLDAPADGAFGKNTERALRAFQKERGLDTDAIAGPSTWAALSALDQDS